MWRYIVRRLLWVVLVMLVITMVTYVIFFVMPPVDPAVAFAGKSPTPESIVEVRRLFGLDKPVWEQYGLFVKHLFVGDQFGWPGLGFSFATRSPVRTLLADRILITAQLAFGAALVWVCIGIPIGVVSAVRRRSWIDRLSMGLALFFVSAPVFWLGLMGLLLFAAVYARMTRGNLIETMAQDYIRTARVKGLPEWKVIFKHGLRASLTPVVTMFGMDLGTLFGGAVITETVFNLQGMGQWVVTSVFNGDFPAILAVTVVTSLVITLMNLFVDIVYAYLDPRVRYT